MKDACGSYTGLPVKERMNFPNMFPEYPIDIMGPLGNGFPQEGENVFLIGGGIGVPPMLELAKTVKLRENRSVLGYRDENTLPRRMNFAGIRRSL